MQPGLMLPKVDVSKPNVFGSVALSVGRTPLDSKWQRAQASALSGRAGPWRGVVGEARGLDQGAKIELVNSWVNRRVNFIDDSVRFKVADRWATATETLRAGQGDCEDYAIAKMKLLEAAGVARGDMFLVIAKDLVRRADHALLVVRNGDRLMVLDNNTDRIVDAATIRDYRPVMSYSAGKAWLHGYATQPEVVQPAPIRIAALSS
jgi:predicted transglutaminase-like cysteine proteinase